MVLYEGLDIIEIVLSGVIGMSDFGPELRDLLQMLVLFVYKKLVEGEIEIMYVFD